MGADSANPMVGAVIFNGDEKVGEGFHARYGEAHAEVWPSRRPATARAANSVRHARAV